MGAAALAAVSLTASPALNAQENRDENGKIVRGPYETNRFGDNWFIGAGGGINILWNENYENVKISPSIDANIGKWFTPSVGMRVGYQGFSAQIWSDTPDVLGSTLDTDKGMYLQKMGYMYIHGDFLWNMSNAFGGYKEHRFWNLVPYIHSGFFRSYGLDDVDFADNEFAMGGGLLHNLRLARRVDLMIDMRATVVNGRIHGADGVAVLPTVTAGLSVDLGWPEFTRTADIVGAVEAAYIEKSAILETAIAALEVANSALAADADKMAKKNAKLTKQVKDLENRPTFDIEAFFENMSPAYVYFDIGKTKLDNRQMQQLDFIAQNLLTTVDQDTNILITVLGSADGNTGTQKWNQHLSEARAKYIFDILTTKYGISPERLTMKAEVVQKATVPELSRAVIFTF
jgi:outer membrane protein OmpA-like peptidoglycan-associated protein